MEMIATNLLYRRFVKINQLMFVQCFQHAKCHKAPWIITSVLALKCQRGVIEYKLHCKLQCPQSQTPCRWYLSKQDCKTRLIQHYLIYSLPVKSLPFKITFATCREDLCCHQGTVADGFFWAGGANADPLSVDNENQHFFFVSFKERIQQKEFLFSWRDFEILFCFEGMWKREDN